MNAKDIFPDEEERKEIKEILDYWKATITKVETSDGKVIYENALSCKNIKKNNH